MVILVGLVVPGTAAMADTPFTVVADGLHSPRGLAFGPGDVLYVAQAGDATADGSIVEIRNSMSQHPKVRTVVDGLAKATDEGDSIGVSGISVRGAGNGFSLYGVTGLAPQITGENAFGGLFEVDKDGTLSTVANVGQVDFQWALDHPDLWEEFVNGDANPYGVLATPDHVYVVDAGANTLDEVMPDGSVHVLVFFPNEAIRDAIPTCVAQGPDGALYVGTLALVDSVVFGPSAKVYRVDPSQVDENDPTDPGNYTLWASGLFPINGCAFGPDGSFYASELFTNPATPADFGGNPDAAFGAIFGDPQGDVVEIPFDSPSTHMFLTGGALAAAGGVAVAPNGDVFVADGTSFVQPGGGRVLRLGH
jgi:hypothetical protein